MRKNFEVCVCGEIHPNGEQTSVVAAFCTFYMEGSLCHWEILLLLLILALSGSLSATQGVIFL